MQEYVCQIKKGKITFFLKQLLEADKNILSSLDHTICVQWSQPHRQAQWNA